MRRRGPNFDPTHLYLRIASTLRMRVGSQWQVGARLPTESALAAEFGVAIGTIRQAVDILETEGIVARYQGKGTEVLRAPRGVGQQLKGSMQDLLSFHAEVTVKVLKRHTVQPPMEVRRTLALGENEKRIHLQRLASFDGAPIALTDSYVPIEYDRVLTNSDLNTRTLISLLWTKCRLGLLQAEQSISAQMVSPAVARVLKVPVGFPVIVLARTDYDADGRPILFTTCQYRADRYRIDVTLAPVERQRKDVAISDARLARGGVKGRPAVSASGGRRGLA